MRAWGQRLALIALGTVFGLALLEAGLRSASLWFAATRRNPAAVASDATFRILCIGESTTQGAWWVGAEKTWPKQLETLLRERRPDLNVEVINQGQIGASSDGIVDLVDGWLDTYRPQVVIVMMGINDEGNVLVYEHPGAEEAPPILGRLRLYKLLRLLWRSVRAESPGAAPPAPAPPNVELDAAVRAFSEASAAFEYTKVIELKRDTIKLDPGTPVYHYGTILGMIIHDANAEEVALFFNKKLGAEVGALSDAQREARLLQFLDEQPDNFASYKFLTTFYHGAARADAIEAVLKRGMERSTIRGYLALRLAYFYFQSNRLDDEAPWLREAERRMPRDRVFLMVLGDYLFRTRRYRAAAEMYEKGLALRTDRPVDLSDLEYRQLALSYELAGETALAEKYFALDATLGMGRFRERTRRSYERLLEKLRAHSVGLIAMQYPMLSVLPLRKLLDFRDDIAIVDNESNFKAALAQSQYEELFVDHFAGAFGHLTAKGNALIAEHLAPVVLATMAGGGPVGATHASPTD
ncbi:MAG: hypothetical protein HYR72_14025 [Deltaproteobacteria bacterium]|nr:hypothetical protein [Deltaproteobacteria bacterium]MBI3391462.1 hypothetical protein [Deltaproteobacteria bacterium]